VGKEKNLFFGCFLEQTKTAATRSMEDAGTNFSIGGNAQIMIEDIELNNSN
jgi:hypothetical protein